MWMYLVLCCILQKTSSIRLVSIYVPERVSAGQGVGLSCFYDLEGDKLYNIKWYFDGVEFYRYVPSDLPSRLFFPVKGIQVDLERSGNGTVFIQDVKTNTSGKYSCEISADAPSFQTLQAARMMAVEELSEGLTSKASGLAAEPSFPLAMMLIIAMCSANIFRRCCQKQYHVNNNTIKNYTLKQTHLVKSGVQKYIETNVSKMQDVTQEWTKI